MLKLHKCDEIFHPILTEKSIAQNSLNKYHFAVHAKSSKTSIKSAVEMLFGVKVKVVHVMNINGKIKIRNGKQTKMQDSKKAIVTLEEGNSISFE